MKGIKRSFFLLIWFALGCQSTIVPISSHSSRTSDSSCGEKCKTHCRENFLDPQAYDQCVNLSDEDVDKIQRSIHSMKRGSWNSIQEDQLSLITDISYEPWIQYSTLNQNSTMKMLEWIGENRWVGDYLDSDGDVLKEGLASLSHLPHDSGTLDGLKKDISKDKKMTFIELTAWEDNDIVFQKIHDMIVDVCDRKSKCTKKVYCSQSSDIVLETVNNLDLTGDVVSQNRFHRGLCN